MPSAGTLPPGMAVVDHPPARVAITRPDPDPGPARSHPVQVQIRERRLMAGMQRCVPGGPHGFHPHPVDRVHRRLGVGMMRGVLIRGEEIDTGVYEVIINV